MTKRVLIVSYYFHQDRMSGPTRIKGLAKNLPDFGWQPTILTFGSGSVSDSTYRVVDAYGTDENTKMKRRLGFNPNVTLRQQLNLKSPKNRKTLLDTLAGLWSEAFAFPDVYKEWQEDALAKSDALLMTESFDALISSSGPARSHIVAGKIKRKYGLPWIADFRDLWTQNHYYDHTRARMLAERWLEVKTVASSNAITTVSEQLASQLAQLHGRRNVTTILNGIDDLFSVSEPPETDKLVITYTGNLYGGKRDPELLFAALEDLANKGEVDLCRIQVDFYGPEEEWVLDEARRHGLDGVVRILGEVTREEAIQIQRASQILLLLTRNDPREIGVYTGKVFEYMAARRPILSIGVEGSALAELLESTGSGVHTSHMVGVGEYLRKAYREYANSGTVGFVGKDYERMKYTQREMARKFAMVLDSVSGG